MSVLGKAVRSGAWFAGFKVVTQVISWMVTIVVARILAPEDYGLLALATLLTGYVEIFSEFGLGAAIVQREEITQQEYSSNFWFSLFIGTGFSVIAFGLAYPTSWIVDEPRIIPVTQVISVLFIVGSLMVVPYNMLMRNFRFKEVGLIQLLSAIVSSSSMLWMAYYGFGVWALIGGLFALRLMTVILVFVFSGWRPDLHFSWTDVRPFLKFGMNVAGARSLSYVFQKFDTFIVGRVLGLQALGYYAFAMELASLPTEKIVAVVNQISFPIISRFQTDLKKIQDFYLKTTRYQVLLLSPLFWAGALWGEEIIYAILGEKWAPIIFLFRIFCLSQLIFSMTAINGVVHKSMGHSHWLLYFHLLGIIMMPISIYWAAQIGLSATSIPWLTVYPLLCIGWTWVTLKKLKIAGSVYVFNLIVQVFASFLVVFGIKASLPIINRVFFTEMSYKLILLQEMSIGIILYLSYLFLFERKTLVEIWNIRRA